MRWYSSSTSSLHRSQVLREHGQSFETAANSLLGGVWVEIDPLDIHNRLNLAIHGNQAMTPTVWIAPLAEQVLQSGAIQYLELDSSYRALTPCACIVPLAVTANYGIPLGLMPAPTERMESMKKK
jgi:hypothetical protein